MPVTGVESNPFAILTFIAAPALLTNASSLLALGTSNRFARNVDRARALLAMLEGRATSSAIRAPRFIWHCLKALRCARAFWCGRCRRLFRHRWIRGGESVVIDRGRFSHRPSTPAFYIPCSSSRCQPALRAAVSGLRRNAAGARNAPGAALHSRRGKFLPGPLYRRLRTGQNVRMPGWSDPYRGVGI